MTGSRVLLVDDDAQMRRSTAQALDLAGFAVEALASGEEALTLAGPGFAGAVVSDIRMPGMDGMTLLGRLHEIDPDIPVILFTGHAEVPLAVEAIRSGAYDFIEKPFVVHDLATVIRRAIDHRDLILDNRRLRAVAGKRDDVEARLPDRVGQFERSLIAGAIGLHKGRLRAVYEDLGISRKTLYEKMQKYGLDRRLIVEPGDDDAG